MGLQAAVHLGRMPWALTKEEEEEEEEEEEDEDILDNQCSYNKLIIWLDHLFKSLYFILCSEILSGCSPCIISGTCTV
jgi:hypothetical protein